MEEVKEILRDFMECDLGFYDIIEKCRNLVSVLNSFFLKVVWCMKMFYESNCNF